MEETESASEVTEVSVTQSSGHSESEDMSESSRNVSRAISSDSIYDFGTEEEDEEDEGENAQSAKTKIRIQKILTHRVKEGTDNTIEFLCKITSLSYHNSQWIEDSTIRDKHGLILRRTYLKHNRDKPPQPPYYNPNFDIPDRILDVRTDAEAGIKQYLIKWTDLDYDQVTWEDESDLDCPALIETFDEYNKLPDKKDLFIPAHPNANDWVPLTTFPPSKTGLTLRPYQVEGLNFFVNSWFNNRNPILADEMGLGKTVQATSLLKYLSIVQHIRGPFLVVAPLSTIAHWEREIAEWTDLKVLTYIGGRVKRNLIKQHEFFFPETTITKFQVLLTTYQLCIRDEKLLSTIDWRVIIVDEAHRLKNRDSKLIVILRALHADFRVLMTGTPLQNNTDELWSLLNFVDEKGFNSLQEFQSRFGELTENEQIIELQSLLKPRMLRRLKSDVEKAIAPMEEVIIECPMTAHQKQYYQSIFHHNMEFLTRGVHKTQMTNMKNIHMELRKVCNHPYLLNGAEDQILIERKESAHIPAEDMMPQEFIDDALIRSSGKMILLDKLLGKLKADGRRVLIFSQMVRMLAIIEDFCSIRKYTYVRLDGSIRGEERQAAIDAYNAPDSDIFIFLICTKAGGLGINLTSADTVIIYDSDWNPQNDIQATARCHRIGQTKEVHVYRFITSNSYERKMFERASIKLGLGTAVLETTKQQKAEEMEKLLRYGAYYAFEDDKDKDADVKFSAENIDSILTRSRRIIHESVVGTNSTFSKAQFELEEEKDEKSLMNPDFWKKYLPAVVEEEVIEGVSIGERRRIMREGLSAEQLISEQTEHPTRERRDGTSWSKTNVNSLSSNLFRFGWGRWKIISEKSQLAHPINEIKSVCHVFLSWLLAHSDGQYPVMEAIYNMPMQGQTKEDAEFEKKWNRKYKRDFEKIVTGGATWKLSRLDLLHFVNQLVVTTTNPPDEIPVPSLSSAKVEDWWGVEDDKMLIYCCWRDGFSNYNNVTFPNQPTENDKPDQRALTTRLRALVSTIKLAFVKMKEQKNEEVSFTSSALREATETWSKRDHKLFCHTISNYGYTTPEDFREVSQITGKTPAQIDAYYEALTKFAKELTDGKEDPDCGNLAEKPPLNSCMRYLSRVEFFQSIRETAASGKYSNEDQQLLDFISKTGYLKLSEEPFIEQNYGPAPFEGKVSKRLKELVRHTSGAHSKSRVSYQKLSFVPQYEKNPDGSPVFPIKCGSTLVIISLGEIVFDRPGFHSERYFYTPGFVTERLYQSCVDPSKKEWYVSKIIDRGGDEPQFRVELKSDPEHYFWEWNRPSNPWLAVVKAVDERKKELGMTEKRSLSISGPDYFGLAMPITIFLQSKLPNADKCFKFNRRQLEEAEQSAEDLPPPEPRPPRPPRASRSTEKSQETKTQEKLLLPTVITLNFEGLRTHPDLKEKASSSITIDTGALLDRGRLDLIFPQTNDLARSAIESIAHDISLGND